MKIDFIEFLRTGQFGPLGEAPHQGKVFSMFGEPDMKGGISCKYSRPSIWKYGDIEFFFDRETWRLKRISTSNFDDIGGGGQLDIVHGALRGGQRLSEAQAVLNEAGVGFHEDEDAISLASTRVLATSAGVELYIDDETGLCSIGKNYHIDKPKRRQLSITIPWKTYLTLREMAKTSGESMSSIAARWVIARADEE